MHGYLDFEPDQPAGAALAAAQAEWDAHHDATAQAASVARVRASMLILAQVIETADFPLGSPFVGWDIDRVVREFRGGSEFWPVLAGEVVS